MTVWARTILLALACLWGNLALAASADTNVTLPPEGDAIGFGVADNQTWNGENRCDVLGPMCVCSEPMVGGFLEPGGKLSTDPTLPNAVTSWDPTDTTTKECQHIEGADNFVGGTPHLVQPDNDVTALAALPNATITSFMGKPTNFPPDPQAGSWEFGHKTDVYSPGAPTKRRSWRWYQWYSTNFEICIGGIQNGKFAKSPIYNTPGQNYWTVSAPPGDYSWAWGGPAMEFIQKRTSTAVNGSMNGTLDTGLPWQDTRPPGFDGQLAGRWIRYEWVVDNGESDTTIGAGSRGRMYAKNVTSNDPEIKIVDTYCPHRNSGDGPGDAYLDNCTWTNNSNGGVIEWDGALSDDLSASPRDGPGDWFYVEAFNQANDSIGCAGSGNQTWEGYSHFIHAAWDASDMGTFDLYGADVWNETDHRIGSSEEMEGVSGAIDPP